MALDETVRRVIRQEGLIDPGDTVLVGVSGGIDSSTLLFLLERLKKDMAFGLGVAHVNHQLRGEDALGDEAFVRALADGYGVPCHVLRADVPGYARKNGLSVQHAGRDIRYRYFDEVAAAHGYRKIAIAHNRDDQVETFLLRLVKGSGLSGLASIPIRRGPVIRPLLRVYRAEIAAFARRHSLAYREDSSNLSEKYERNFIRSRIVPLMEQLNPRFKEKVLFLLADIASVNTVFDDAAAAVLERRGAVRPEGEGFRVGVGELSDLRAEVRFRVVSRLLSRLSPRFIALREHAFLIESALFSQRPNNMVMLPGGIRVIREYGDLIFTREGGLAPPPDIFEVRQGTCAFPSLGVTLDVSFEDERPKTFPENPSIAYFDAGRISGLSLRTFREGDRFVPLGMERSIKVKDYFIAKKVPRGRRRKTPFLLSGGDIIWVVGMRISDLYKVTGATTRVLRVTASETSGRSSSPTG
jgi:tRNA(Ile)-lysidine synthase